MKEYFSHDYNARNDPKLVNLFMKKGLTGLGLYWCLAEMMYECSGKIMLSECERIAFELRIDLNEINSIINEFDLFKKDKKYFWSETILKRLELRNEKSKKASASAYARWNNANALQTQSEGNAIKVKKRKVKENKNIFIPPTQNEVIDYFAEKGYKGTSAIKFFDYYSVGDWHDSQGNKIKNWKQKAQSTWFKDENKITQPKKELNILETQALKTKEKLDKLYATDK